MSLDIIQFVVKIRHSDFKYNISRYHKMHAINEQSATTPTGHTVSPAIKKQCQTHTAS